MRKADLRPGMEVAVKAYRDVYMRGIVVDTTGWSERRYYSRHDPEQVQVLEDGKRHDIARFHPNGKHVLVEVFEPRYGGGPDQPRLRAVALPKILGVYSEHKEKMDEEARVRRDRMARQREHDSKVDARREAAVKRLEKFSADYEGGLKPYDSLVRVTVGQLEALLDAAEAH